MATCKVNTELHVECSICLNEFQTPKALPCLHTFCQKCLQNYVNRNYNLRDESFLCPVCRAICKPRFIIENGSTIPVKQIVKHLPTNFYINSENNQQKKSPNTENEVLDDSSLENLEQFEKQIYDHKKKIEQQYRRNMILAQSLKDGLRFCPKDNQSGDSFENRVQYVLNDEFSSVQKKHDSLDKSLMELEKIREETVNLIMSKDTNRKQKKRQKKSKDPGNSFDIKLNLNMFKKNLESTFEQLTISESQNELKTLTDQMQLLWMNPDRQAATLFPKITHDTSIHTFPMINELLYICSVKVTGDDTVVVCGKFPNLLLCYDANSGLLKSRYELSNEPTNMFVYNYRTVLVTFRDKIIIINVGCQPPNIEWKVETKMYAQMLYLNNDDHNMDAILALSMDDAYHVLKFRNGVENSLTIKNKGRIPDKYPGCQMAYIKQRNIVLYPDKSRKCLQAFGLSSKKIEFKYDGDPENPLVVISSVCCSESFIFIADKRHYKVHKLSFYGRSLEIIQCHNFGIMWPLHIDVNQCRTMVICSQKKDSSYVVNTFLS